MPRIQFRNWTLDAAPATTRDLRAAAGVTGARACMCGDCRNFLLAREQGLVYPIEFLRLLESLGLTDTDESEVTDFAAEDDGRHVVSGWFHAVGSVLEGPPARTQLNETTWRSELAEIAPGFEIAISNDRDVAPAVFENVPLIQLEFFTRIPWVSSEPEA